MKKFRNLKIFIADKIHSEGINTLNKKGFSVIECFSLTNNRMLEFIKNNTGPGDSGSCLVVRSIRNIGKAEIDILRTCSIELICTASSGFDNVDVVYCRENKIKVLNVPFGNYISAAEHTIALILNILKSIDKANSDVKNGIFDEKIYANHEFAGKRIGIVGVGKVGSHVAKLSRAFGAIVMGNDIKKTLKNRYKWIKFKELTSLIKESDIVSVHTPLDDSTRNLLDGKKLNLLKSSAILINCARGGIVNEKELIKLLKLKKIYYAGIDVFNNEPGIDIGFKRLNNVILTPHLAGKTVESRKRISVQLAGRIIDYYTNKIAKNGLIC